MADVVITPQTSNINFYYTTGGTVVGNILMTSANVMVLTAAGGVQYGSGTSDIYIGDGTNSIDIIYQQSGDIRALTGRTLTIGQSDSYVTLAAPTTATARLTTTTQTWNGDITWNTGKNVLISGESSFDLSSGGQWTVWDGAAAASMIRANYGSHIVLAENGKNVGIGNGSPTYKLDVSGNVHISGAGYNTFEGTTSRFYNAASQSGSYAGEIAGLQVFQPTTSSDACMTFHVAGDYAVHFGLDGTTNDLFVGGWSMGAVKYKIWHAGNDGTGSGLDADTLDGSHASSFVTSGGALGTPSSGTLTNCTGLPVGGISATGSASATTYLRGDGSWQTISAGGLTVNVESSSANTYYPLFTSNTTGSVAFANVDSGDLYYVPVTGTLSAKIFNSLSDITLKTDIEGFDGIALLDQINPVSFKWASNNVKSYGVIAQELEKTLPELVDTNDKGIKSVSYIPMIAMLIDTVKKQEERITKLEQLLNAK